MLKSIEQIVKELGHEGREIDILKIDIEGSEYSAMPPLFESIRKGTIKVNQIQIELHAASRYVHINPKDIAKLFDSADRAKMRIFHKERNHWGCDGFKCVEYAFVSESFLRQANAGVVCSDEAIWSSKENEIGNATEHEFWAELHQQ